MGLIERATPLFHAPDREPFGFKCRSNLGNLVALDFDGPISHRSAGTAGCAQLFGHFFNDGNGQMRRKIVNDYNRFSASMGGFAPEQNPAHLPDRFIRNWGRRGGVF